MKTKSRLDMFDINKLHFLRKPLSVLLPAASLVATAPAFGALEEVIVTATKRSESLQDVPIAVTALQGEELFKSGIDSTRSIAMSTPNVAINFNAFYVAPYVRGVGTQYANPGLEPSVATYFNDLYIARPMGGMMNFSDIERVEVLKGPQGTLYGRNTTGGAIRVITKDPTPEFEAGLGLTAGNYDRRKADGFISGPLAKNLMGRLSFQYDERDGYIDNLTGPDLADRDLGMVHGKLLWEPSDRLRVKLDVDYVEKADYEGVAFQPLFDGLPEQVAGAFGGTVVTDSDKIALNNPGADNPDGKGRMYFGGSQLRADYEFDSFTFSSITGYRYARFKGHADLDGTDFNFFNASTPADKTKDYSQEFQLVSNGDGDVDWILGVFYLKEDAVSDFNAWGIAIDGGLGYAGATVGGLGDIDVESIAPYGQIAYHLTDELEFMVGARYTDETKEMDNQFFIGAIGDNGVPIDSSVVNAAPPTSDEFSFSKTTPKVQLTWRPDDGIMFYASYSEGLKSGGFQSPHPAPTSPAQVDNEEIQAYELGWKTETDRIRFNGAIFHYEVSELQVQVTNASSGITSAENVSGGTVDGIESDLTYAATDNLELGAGFGYQKTEIENGVMATINQPCSALPSDPGCVALGGLGLTNELGDVGGNDLPQAPELTGYVRGTYLVDLGDSGELSFTLLASYTDKFYYTPDNFAEEDSKTLVNANASWTWMDGKYSINGFVNNLTDEEYYTHQSPFAASGGWKVRGEPRMYGVRFGMNFY